MNRVNLVLMGKGGVGKTLVSWVLSQYYCSSGRNLYCADTDPTNASFSRFKMLNVEHIDIATDSMVVDPGKFDTLIERLHCHEGEAVIDNGASSFLPLISYLYENNVFEMLREAGYEIVVHTPLVGGVAMDDTLSGLRAIIGLSNADVVIWKNEYFGPLVKENVPVLDLPFVKSLGPRVLGNINIRHREPKTFGADIREVMGKRLTFDEAYNSPDIRLMQKQRLQMIRRDLFGQLAAMGL
jgi:hypothetical protein